VVSIDAKDATRAAVALANGRRYATSDGGRTWSEGP
jgi:hypothetical protein